MDRDGQLSITIGVLGIVVTLIGLFPGLIGLETVEGIGVLQVLVILVGFSLLFLGAYVFVKETYFSGQPNTLGQDIGVRLTLTGLVLAGAAGLADVLGFGTHTPSQADRPYLGAWQAAVFLGGFLLASAGVVVYTLFGPVAPDEDGPEPDDVPRNHGTEHRS